MEKPYAEFEELLASFYEDTFRLHHWVYKRQDDARHKCRRNYQKGDIVIELDYAAKLKQFEQDAMPCSAAKQTSNFIVYVHFDPVQDETGKNIDDTTEVFSFHSDCTKQDTHSIRRYVTHIIENMKSRGKLRRGGTVHTWADGSAEQNKGRKAFRQLSELSAVLGVTINTGQLRMHGPFRRAVGHGRWPAESCHNHPPGKWSGQGWTVRVEREGQCSFDKAGHDQSWSPRPAGTVAKNVASVSSHSGCHTGTRIHRKTSPCQTG